MNFDLACALERLSTKLKPQKKGFDWSNRWETGVQALLTTCNANELKVLLINHGSDPFPIRRGERIAQLVPAAVTPARFEEVEELCDTERGAGGFGSTGQ